MLGYSATVNAEAFGHLGISAFICLFGRVGCAIPSNDGLAGAAVRSASRSGGIALAIGGVAPAAATSSAVALVRFVILHNPCVAAYIATTAATAAFT